MKARFCFVTEADLDRKGVGGVINDQQILRCLKELGEVDVIYLKRTKYRSTALALTLFFSQILSSFSKPYAAYFSRGFVTSMFLATFNTLTSRRRVIVHRALSVPLGSREVRFLKFGRTESLFRYSLFLIFEHFIYSQVDKITVAGEVYGQELIDVGVGKEKIHVTSFIAEDEFFEQPPKTTVDGAFRFCYVGGFHLYQDMQPLLEAFERIEKTCSDAELILAGDGPQRPHLEEEATRKNLRNRLRFVGMIPHSSLPGFLSKMDCFISLTRKPGLSISIVEAAAAGKAIIAFAPGNRTNYNGYFTHKKEIYLVNSVLPDEIAEAMEMLYKDSSLRNIIAEGAREIAERNFSQRVVREQVKNLVQKIGQKHHQTA